MQSNTLTFGQSNDELCKIKKALEQIEQIAYDITGGLENIDVLNRYVFHELESMLEGLKRTNVAPYLIEKAERMTQLGYIIDEIMKKTKENTDIMFESFN